MLAQILLTPDFDKNENLEYSRFYILPLENENLEYSRFKQNSKSGVTKIMKLPLKNEISLTPDFHFQKAKL